MVHVEKSRVRVKSSLQYPRLGWIYSYTGTDVHMFVPKFGLIRLGQKHICPQLWAFLHENVTLAYFVFLGDRSSALSLTLAQVR